MSVWINAAINESPVVNGTAGADMSNVAHRAVKLDSSGNTVLAGTGDLPLGVLISSMDGNIPAGSDVSIQVKDIGYIEMSEDIEPGDAVTVTDFGKGAKATAGTFILGFALTSGENGGHVQIQITKSGFMV